ncbi:hypothetical protein DXG01_016696 [Tephrocybe rancida]|nr:hypothetical protein DXG01_016696 [Tephrocybe rancida]
MSVIVTQAPSTTAEEMRIAAVATALLQTADPDTSRHDQETRTWQRPGGLVTPIPKQRVQSEAGQASVGAVTPSQGNVGVTELESPQVRRGREQQTAVPMATPTTNGRNRAQSTPGTLRIPHTPVFSPIPQGVKPTPRVELTPESAIEDRCRIRFRPAQHFFQNASSLGLSTTPEIHTELVVEDDTSDTDSGQNAEEATFNCRLAVYWMEHPEVPKVSIQCRLQEQTHRSLGEQQVLGVAILENLVLNLRSMHLGDHGNSNIPDQGILFLSTGPFDTWTCEEAEAHAWPQTVSGPNVKLEDPQDRSTYPHQTGGGQNSSGPANGNYARSEPNPFYMGPPAGSCIPSNGSRNGGGAAGGSGGPGGGSPRGGPPSNGPSSPSSPGNGPLRPGGGGSLGSGPPSGRGPPGPPNGGGGKGGHNSPWQPYNDRPPNMPLWPGQGFLMPPAHHRRFVTLGVEAAQEYHRQSMHQRLINMINQLLGIQLHILDGMKLRQSDSSKTITPYTGSSKFSELEDWLMSICIFFAVAQYGGEGHDREKVLIIMGFIKDEALKWYLQHVIHVNWNRLQWSFTDVVMGLYNCFVQPSTMQDACEAFHKAAYIAEDGVQGYYDSLLNHAQNMAVYPDKYTIRKKFLDGILSDMLFALICNGGLSPEVNTVEGFVSEVKAYETSLKMATHYLERSTRAKTA